MTAAVVNWIWQLSNRDLAALIGLSCYVAAWISWKIEIPGRYVRAINNVADAIRSNRNAN